MIQNKLLGCLLFGLSFTLNAAESQEVRHTVIMSGLNESDGRYIKNVVIDSKFGSQSYVVCLGNGTIFREEYSTNISLDDRTVNLSFSMCNDYLGLQCTPLATDEYHSYTNESGKLVNDVYPRFFKMRVFGRLDFFI